MAIIAIRAQAASTEGDRWEEANRYAAITAEVLSGYCDGIDRATALLSGRK